MSLRRMTPPCLHLSRLSAAPAMLLTVTCLYPLAARAQTGFIAPDGRNRYPGVTIFCPSGTGVAPCNFGGGGGGGTGGAVTQAGSWSVGLAAGSSVAVSTLPALPAGANAIGSVAISNFPASQTVTGTVGQAGNWSVGLAAGSSVAVSALPALPAGGNAIGSVAISNFPASQTVTGAVNQAGSWNVGLAAGSNAIGSVAVTNLPATQVVSAASLPLPAGAATAAAQAATLAPVAPGAATATSSVVIGCVSNTVLPSFAAGQQGAVPCDTAGRPYVVTVPSATNVPAYLQAVSGGGASVYRAINAAGSTMAAVAKPSSGMVYGYEACNSGSAAAYLRLFALGAAPAVGTSVPQVSKLVAPGSCQTLTTSIGLVFSGGIALDVTAGSLADADTTAVATASQVSVEVYYK